MSTGLQSIEKSSHLLADVAFDALRDAIIDGRLQAGEWLRQEKLAQELGTSQMPVREALKRLVAEGLAERIPYRGVRVIEFSPADIVDICTIRLMLETLAVRLATPLISVDEIQRLKDNLRRAESYRQPEQMARLRELNTEFHLSICRASGRRYLVHQVEVLWDRFPSVMLYEGEVRRQSELLQPRLERAAEEHWRILTALEQRDAQRAEEETRHHIQELAQELTEVLNISHEQVEPLLIV